jgi:hypothetical protein
MLPVIEIEKCIERPELFAGLELIHGPLAGYPLLILQNPSPRSRFKPIFHKSAGVVTATFSHFANLRFSVQTVS